MVVDMAVEEIMERIELAEAVVKSERTCSHASMIRFCIAPNCHYIAYKTLERCRRHVPLYLSLLHCMYCCLPSLFPSGAFESDKFEDRTLLDLAVATFEAQQKVSHYVFVVVCNNKYLNSCTRLDGSLRY